MNEINDKINDYLDNKEQDEVINEIETKKIQIKDGLIERVDKKLITEDGRLLLKD